MIGVGDKVVCVEDFHGRNCRPGCAPNIKPCGLPQKGEIYVVTGFWVSTDGQLVGIQLIGKPIFSSKSGLPTGWLISKFRKLEDHRNEQELAYYREHPQPVPSTV